MAQCKKAALHDVRNSQGWSRRHGNLYILSWPVQLSWKMANTPVSAGLDRDVIGLSMSEILLRGCTLKNSKTIQGMVIYTGPETRIQQNSAAPPRKLGKSLIDLIWPMETCRSTGSETEFLGKNRSACLLLES